MVYSSVPSSEAMAEMNPSQAHAQSRSMSQAHSPTTTIHNFQDILATSPYSPGRVDPYDVQSVSSGSQSQSQNTWHQSGASGSGGSRAQFGVANPATGEAGLNMPTKRQISQMQAQSDNSVQPVFVRHEDAGVAPVIDLPPAYSDQFRSPDATQ